MLRTRIIPCLLLKDASLIKTVKFKKYNYIGDPVNTVRIFNELEVDELMFLDIFASLEQRKIDFELLKDIASECFMPLSYGGNVGSLDDAKKIFEIGFEKVVINSNAFKNLELISNISNYFGTQSVIGAIDVKKTFLGNYKIFSHHGTKRQIPSLVTWAKTLVDAGVGEIMLTAIDNDGTWKGYDLDIVRIVADSVNVPVIANGGAGKIDHLKQAVAEGHASAVAVGSMVVYQKQGMGVLINFPDKKELSQIL